MMREFISGLTMLAFVSMPVGATADGAEYLSAAGRIVVLFTPPSPLLVDLEAELRIAGFEPVRWAEDGTETVSLEAAAVKAQASAAVRILPSGTGVTVFVFDTLRGVSVSTRVDGVDAGARTSAVIAIKTAELLRVGLMRPPPSPPPGPPTPATGKPRREPVNTGRKAADTAGRLYLAAAPSIAYGFGGLPPSFQAAMSVSLRPAHRVRLFVYGLLPTFGSKFTAAEGAATVRLGLVSAGVSVFLRDEKYRLVPHAGVQGGALFFQVEGSGRDPYYGEHPSGVPFAVNFQTGAVLRLGRITALRWDVLVGAVFPEPVIRFDGRAAASFGRPMISGSFGAEVRLF